MGYSGVEPVSSDALALTGPVTMNQSWRDLTFLHWAVGPEEVANWMPPGSGRTRSTVSPTWG